MTFSTAARACSHAFARARHIPRVFAWCAVVCAVVLAMGHVRWRQIHPSLARTPVRGHVRVLAGDRFEVDGRVYALRGVRAPMRGTPAGECAAASLQALLRQGPIGVLRVAARADTVDVFAVVGDSIPVNAVLLWEGATPLGTLSNPEHPLDRTLVLAATGGAAQKHPRCGRSS